MEPARRLGTIRRIGPGRLERFLARPWRLALLVIVAVGIPIGALSAGQVRETVEELRRQTLAQGTRTSLSVATIIDDRLGALRDALTTVTADPDVRDATAARDGVRLAGLLHRARGVMGPDVGSLKAFDHSGVYLAGSPFEPGLIGRSASGSDHVVRSMLAGGASISGVETSADVIPTVALAAPVRDLAGGLIGVISVHVDLERISGWVTPFLGSVDDVYLVDGRGRVVLRASDPRDRLLHDLSGDALVQAVLAGGPLPEEASDPLTGRPAFAAARPLSVAGWHVLTIGSSERLERQLRPLTTSFAATTITLVALLLAGAVLLAHTSARVLEAVRQQALTDPLTGLYNRRFMNEQLALFDSLAERHGRPYSVVAFDLDGLKRVNDTFGHDAGDAVIKEFGERLRDCLRDSDVAIRLGGDEFISILPETSMREATAVFERVRAAVRAWASDPKHAVTVSAGAVTWRSGRAAEELVHVADEMLYRAKRAGKDRVVAEPLAAGG